MACAPPSTNKGAPTEADVAFPPKADARTTRSYSGVESCWWARQWPPESASTLRETRLAPPRPAFLSSSDAPQRQLPPVQPQEMYSRNVELHG